MPDPMKKLADLAAKIDALSPSAQLLMASQLVKQAPDFAVIIAQKAINQLEYKRLMATAQSEKTE